MNNKTAKDLVVSSTGEILAKTGEELVLRAQMLINSQMLPSRYKTPSQVVVGQQYARELGVPMLTGLKQIAIIKGTPSIYGDLPLAIVRNSGKMEWIEEILFDKNSDEICYKNKNLSAAPYGYVCRTKRKDDDKIRETFFTIDDARKANIFNNVWLTYPKLMLKYRARTENLKDKFSDVLNGINIAEYDNNDPGPELNKTLINIDNEEDDSETVDEFLIDTEPVVLDAVVAEGATTTVELTCETEGEMEIPAADVDAIEEFQEKMKEQGAVMKDVEKKEEPKETKDVFVILSGKKKGLKLSSITPEYLKKLAKGEDPGLGDYDKKKILEYLCERFGSEDGRSEKE